jgi:hypothetical protein
MRLQLKKEIFMKNIKASLVELLVEGIVYIEDNHKEFYKYIRANKIECNLHAHKGSLIFELTGDNDSRKQHLDQLLGGDVQ